MNSRIKAVREKTGLNMRDFADRLGVSHGAISLIENGKRSVTDQMVKSICREFDVNKNWLETGEGEPFLPQTADLEIAKIVSKIREGDDDLQEFRTELVKILLQMDDDTMKKFMDHICELADLYRKKTK